MPDFSIPGTGMLGQPRGLVQIGPTAIHGEPGTGFEKAADLGEFECENCHYFDAVAGACGQSTMMMLSKQPRLADGRVSVEAEDCCEYVSRMGKKDADNDEPHPHDDATGKY